MTEIVVAKRRPSWLLPIIALSLGVVLLGAGIGVLAVRYDRYINPSEVMAPTLPANSVILVAQQDALHRGDIVLFDRSSWPMDQEGGEIAFRIIGLGGDQVVCCDQNNRIQVNGRAITENYTRFDSPGGHDWIEPLPFDHKVPDGSIFVLGDWRTNSADSIIYGPVPESAIIGTVVGRSAGTLSLPSPLTPPSAFTDAGLDGVSAADRMAVYAWWAMVVGAIWSVLALIWVIVVGSLRATRPKPVALPPVPAESH